MTAHAFILNRNIQGQLGRLKNYKQPNCPKANIPKTNIAIIIY